MPFGARRVAVACPQILDFTTGLLPAHLRPAFLPWVLLMPGGGDSARMIKVLRLCKMGRFARILQTMRLNRVSVLAEIAIFWIGKSGMIRYFKMFAALFFGEGNSSSKCVQLSCSRFRRHEADEHR